MTLQEALISRHSVRKYRDIPIETEKAEKLNAMIDEINKQNGMHFQLVLNEPDGFSGRMAHYGSFEGVKNYIVLAAPKNKSVEVGYFGEKLVLEAQILGLNTCWVALTYNKRKAHFTLNRGEKVYIVISIGYGETQGKARPSKTVEQVSNISADTPEWFKKGVEAALLAPTAVNQQKFRIEYNGGNVTFSSGKGFYSDIDLGIAKYHFEIGSGREMK